MKLVSNTPTWIIAVVAIGFALYWFRETLAPFTLALMLWLVIDSGARTLKRRLPFIPGWIALTISLVVILGMASFVIYVITNNIGELAANGATYQARLEMLAVRIQRAAGFQGAPWTVQNLLDEVGPATLLSGIAAAVQSVAGKTVFILIYLLFLFPAAATFSDKINLMAPDPEVRAGVNFVLKSIRSSIERYVVAHTIVNLMIAALSFVTLSIIGLHDSLFWSFLIFFLSFIPTIGAIIAVALPTLFALVQFDDLGHVAAVALGLHVWQFGIGTFIQPRLFGVSLNLSTIVVVLSLAVWGSLWGIAGVFLAAPLTVMLMIVLEQFPATRWIAVLLSDDGRPTQYKKIAAKPS